MKKVRSERSILLAALGKAWMIWPARLETKRRAKDPNRSGWFLCSACKKSFQKVDIDHVVPIVKPSEGWTNWEDYITSRFVELKDVGKLQALCIDCHREKSKRENKLRREKKKEKSND